MAKKVPPVKYINAGDKIDLSKFPNFHRNGNIAGMRKLYYGQDALLVRKGEYIYNVTSEPDIYNKTARKLESKKK